MPQTQLGKVGKAKSGLNQNHKRWQCDHHDVGLSCTDLDGASGDDSHEESGEQEWEAIDLVLSASGMDARPKVEVRGWEVL